MLQFILSPYFRTAVNLGMNQAKKFVDSKIEERVILRVQELVEDEINRFFKLIWKRSKIYFFLILLNVLSIVVLIFAQNFYFSAICALLSITFFCYSIFTHISGAKKVLYYFENFEVHLKKMIVDELESAKAEDMKTKIALLINSKKADDYYNLVLDQVVKCIAEWLKSNKSVLYVRFGFYIASTVLFSLSLREMLSAFYL